MSAAQGLPNAEVTQALRNFRQVFNAIKTHFQQMEKRSGLGGAQVWALSIIREQPGLGTGALAEAMEIRRSTASNLIKGLLERELIVAEKSATDRRSVQLRLRPAGLKVLKKAPAPFSGVLPEALAQLEPTTLRYLNRDLGKLLAVLHHADVRAAQVPLAEL